MHAKLGDLDAAVGSYEESISLLSVLADQTPDDYTVQIALADALSSLGTTWLSHEQPEVAGPPLRRSIDTYSDVVARHAPDDDQVRKRLAHTHLMLGWASTRTDSPHGAVTHINEAVAVYRELADRAPDDHEAQNSLARTLAVLGHVHATQAQQEQAADSLSRSANILQTLAELDPGKRPSLLIDVLNEIAPILRALGRTDEADQALARADDLAEKYSDEDGQNDE